MNEFFHMGGYAFYVWTSIGITFVVLGANLIAPMVHHRQLRRKIAIRRQRSEN